MGYSGVTSESSARDNFHGTREQLGMKSRRSQWVFEEALISLGIVDRVPEDNAGEDRREAVGEMMVRSVYEGR